MHSQCPLASFCNNCSSENVAKRHKIGNHRFPNRVCAEVFGICQAKVFNYLLIAEGAYNTLKALRIVTLNTQKKI